MSVRPPHFILFSESSRGRTQPVSNTAVDSASRPIGGRWHFSLRTADGHPKLDVVEQEAEPSRERLDLLAVVRGLEALDQPSRVTLVTASGYVHRGLRFGLTTWRQDDWQWECYGQMVPIKNRDLWQRVDRAMQYHDVKCRFARVDRAHDDLSVVCPPPAAAASEQPTVSAPRRPESATTCLHEPRRVPRWRALLLRPLQLLRRLWSGLARQRLLIAAP